LPPHASNVNTARLELQRAMMANPIADLPALRRAPAALATDLNVIAKPMRSVSAIETMLASLLSVLDPLLTDVERLRKTVEPQQQNRGSRTSNR
jgi:hypothetical protein